MSETGYSTRKNAREFDEIVERAHRKHSVGGKLYCYIPGPGTKLLIEKYAPQVRSLRGALKI